MSDHGRARFRPDTLLLFGSLKSRYSRMRARSLLLPLLSTALPTLGVTQGFERDLAEYSRLEVSVRQVGPTNLQCPWGDPKYARYSSHRQNGDDLLLALIRLAKQHGRYGCRKVSALMRQEGWRINHKKVARLWR